MKQQMGQLSGRRLDIARWGSHVPLHRAILKSFTIDGILELGAGIYSTKEFFSSSKRVISIENDGGWIDRLRDHVDEDATHRMVHHVLKNKSIDKGTPLEQVTEKERLDAISFYKQYVSDDINMLFIDGYTCFRFDALQSLYGFFDIVTYHDAEESELYGYNYFRNYMKYLHFIDKTFIVYTGLLIRPDLKDHIPLFMENFKKECEIYADYLNVDAPVRIEDKNETGNGSSS